MKQVFCDDEKCTIENMPRISQKGRGGGGLNPEGSSYLIPIKSSSKLIRKKKTRGRKVQRGRGVVKTSPIQTGKGRRRRRKTASQPGSAKSRTRKRKCAKKSNKRH
jgi:hypothetical protein